MTYNVSIFPGGFGVAENPFVEYCYDPLFGNPSYNPNYQKFRSMNMPIYVFSWDNKQIFNGRDLLCEKIYRAMKPTGEVVYTPFRPEHEIDKLGWLCEEIYRVLPVPQKEPKCVMGCKSFTGGELLHHPDCPFYKGSISERYNKLLAIFEKSKELSTLLCDIQSTIY